MAQNTRAHSHTHSLHTSTRTPPFTRTQHPMHLLILKLNSHIYYHYTNIHHANQTLTHTNILRIYSHAHTHSPFIHKHNIRIQITVVIPNTISTRVYLNHSIVITLGSLIQCKSFTSIPLEVFQWNTLRLA